MPTEPEGGLISRRVAMVAAKGKAEDFDHLLDMFMSYQSRTGIHTSFNHNVHIFLSNALAAFITSGCSL